jgi:EAL domain-containing protein (putative c-di-GMP-specific phosphodiesterase class I)
MLKANRTGPNASLGDSSSLDSSVRLREIVRSGLTSSFQPIYEVGEKMPFAIEGFVRGPVGSALESPDGLFEAAHHADVMLAFDEAVSKIVLMAFAELRWPGKLFLNLRASSLQSSLRAVVNLRRAIDYACLHPSQIVLELTEHEPILDAPSLLRVLDPLFDEGMKLSLDDVGAGFANMRAICELQPHFIKVDRYFIRGIAESVVKRSAVQNFINMASDVGAMLVAEGVEQEEDALALVQMGARLMQGYLFGKPAAKPMLVPLHGRFWDAFV